jgi:hypothetical protein
VRATVTRRLRRQVYGKGTHPGPVKYFTADARRSKTMPKCLQGCCVADQARRDYQALKRNYQGGHHAR